MMSCFGLKYSSSVYSLHFETYCRPFECMPRQRSAVHKGPTVRGWTGIYKETLVKKAEEQVAEFILI